MLARWLKVAWLKVPWFEQLWSIRPWLLASLLLCVQLAAAQDETVRFSLGVAGVVVAEAWNPLRLELRDLPNSTLTLRIDQGTLRAGEVPLTITRSVRGGAGIAVFETDLYIPTFSSLSWRLATPERVVASGSVAGRDSDARPLDLLLSNDPATYRGAHREVFGANGRLAELPSADLPERATAYDGVRSLVIDGTAAAPRLEAVAAAAAGGVIVAFRGDLPSSHNDLELLLEDPGFPTRLGAGVLFKGAPEAASLFQQVATQSVPNRPTLLAAALKQPLVEPPPPLPQTFVLLASGVFSLLLLILLRWAGSPGVVTALALAVLASLLTWQLLRPSEPQLSGQLSLMLAGGALALELPALEAITFPQAQLTYPGGAHPLRLQPYEITDEGAQISLARWRAVLLLFTPQLNASQLRWEGDAVRNVGHEPLYDLYRVGTGPLGELAAGAITSRPPSEELAPWPGYAGLIEQLPSGAVLARSDCLEACALWVLYPEASSGRDSNLLDPREGNAVNGGPALRDFVASEQAAPGATNPFAPSGGAP